VARPDIDPHASRPPGLWSAQHRTLTIGLVLTITLVAFEALAVATIMPVVARDLGDSDLYGWVFTAAVLGSLIGIVVVGGVIDRTGLVRPFLGGLGLFSVGLVIGGLAPSMEVLVLGRALQGLGGGAIPPVAYVAIARALPEDLRARMFATLSTAWVLPGVIGPAISGIVAQTVGWRFVFVGLLPLIAVAAAMTLPAVARSRPPSAGLSSEAGVPARIPLGRRLPFALLVTAGAALIVGGLTDAQLVPGGVLVLAGLAVGLPAFARLVPAGTLRVARGLPAAVLLRGFLTFTFFCADAYVPRALQDWRGLDAATSGIALTAATLAWTGGAWIQAPRFRRLGARRFVATGFLTVGLGIVGFAAVLSPAVPVAIGVVAWGLAGLGMGLSYSPLSLVVLAEAPTAEQGTATSGLSLSDTLGAALGTGVGGALIAAALREGFELWVGLAAAFGVAIVTAFLGAALARRLPGPSRPGAVHPVTSPEVSVA
jgi:MFS family permease